MFHHLSLFLNLGILWTSWNAPSLLDKLEDPMFHAYICLHKKYAMRGKRLLLLLRSYKTLMWIQAIAIIPYITRLRASWPRVSFSTIVDHLICCMNYFSCLLPWLPCCCMLLCQRIFCQSRCIDFSWASLSPFVWYIVEIWKRGIICCRRGFIAFAYLVICFYSRWCICRRWPSGNSRW